MKKYNLNNHKLFYHLDVLNRWQKKERIFPIYISISPSGCCNLKCIFCAYSYLNDKKIFLRQDAVINILKEFKKLGVRAVFYSGEGEPFLNRSFPEMVLDTHRNNIDSAVNTNGLLFNKDICNDLIGKLTFVRYSINAGSSENYKFIHNSYKGAFDTVINNISSAVDIKKSRGDNTTIGVQCLLLKENINDVVVLAKLLKKIGIDYFAIKPFLKHPWINYDTNIDFAKKDVNDLLNNLESLCTDEFRIVIRRNTFDIKKVRDYKKCLSIPFMAEIDCYGDVYPCGPYLGHKEFVYGNIYKNTFEQIWNSDRCRSVMEYIYNKLDVSKCMPNCRNDAVNKFLWQIKNPPEHINFI